MSRVKASASFVAFIACGCGSPTVPESPPTIVGIVVEVNGDAVHVLNDDDPECGIRFWGLNDANIFVQRESGTVRASSAEVVVGIGVEAWAWGGIVEDSCPGGAHLEALVVSIP